LDVKAIRRRRMMLAGISSEVVDLLKDKSLNPTTFEVLRKMKPTRQIEAAELMTTVGNYTVSYTNRKTRGAFQRKVGLRTPDPLRFASRWRTVPCQALSVL